MRQRLYPAEYAADSLEAHLSRFPRRPRTLYLVVLAGCLAGLGALPFAQVDVSTRSPGAIRPRTERHPVRAAAGGLVRRVLVREGDTVRAGQPLVELRSAELGDQAALVAGRLRDAAAGVEDLRRLAARGADGGVRPGELRMPRYRDEYAQAASELQQAQIEARRAEREHERARTMAERGLVAAMEVEEKQFRADAARAELRQRRDRLAARWQAALAEAEAELGRLRVDEGRVRAERALTVVQAPVSGTIDQMMGLSAGSFVAGGDQLALISPAAALIAEVYVAPRDVGLIRVGAPVRMRLDAYDHNDWGMAAGRVLSISDDALIVDGQPMFRVRCSVDREYMQLANGFRGPLRKGMTLRAHFVVARRSLLQLLFDRVDDWVDPTAPAAGPGRA
ncbi:MAG TPA: HlyD family efflux transporter periplasmic adaptor subunit [Longimicrobium sp.]|jgi:HlyD family secretion protein